MYQALLSPLSAFYTGYIQLMCNTFSTCATLLHVHITITRLCGLVVPPELLGQLLVIKLKPTISLYKSRTTTSKT